MTRDIKALAATYGLTTADAIPQPPPRKSTEVCGKPSGQERWDREKKLAFEVLQPAALALVATDGPVSVTVWGRDGEPMTRFGHNRGVWPAKVARTACWKDTVSTTHDQNPFFFVGTQFRIWCPTTEERDRLADAAIELIAVRAEQEGGSAELRRGFQDLGPDLDLAVFQLELIEVGRRVGALAWDDDGLSRLLDRAVIRALTQRSEGRGMREWHSALELALAKEMGRV